MEPGSLQLIALDMLGVFAFALSGGLAAVRVRMDLVGVLALAVTAGLGGGILRDVLIGAVPPVGVTDWRLLAAAVVAGLVTFFLHPALPRLRRSVLVLDGAGLGLFTVVGTLKALDLGASVLTAVIVGVLTGVGGGVVRDMLTSQVPAVLANRELYAIPAAAGATLLAVMWTSGLDHPLVAWAAVVVISGTRLLALWQRWRVPAPRPPAG